uniref:CCHC-type domain-containing protein n=1 Tax=Gasterosteus aculeatus aculeatus TaxID=481459 RepID=A0AAQ4Q544_GASAC
MDPAREESFATAVEFQGAMLGRHQEELSAARQAVESLAAQVNDLSMRLTQTRSESPLTLSHSSSSEPRINNPPCYAGEPAECRAFLTQCEVAFSLQPRTYAEDQARIAYVISLLTGRAREWGTSVWEAGGPCCRRFPLFKEEMIKVFDQSVFGREASRLLTTIRQGKRSVADFAIEFRTLSTTSEWNEPALVARFLEGLNIELKEEIYARGSPADLDTLIELAIRLDRCFQQRRRARTAAPTVRESIPPLAPEPEPMQLGGIHLRPEEKQRRLSNRLCLYCGAAGHFAASCPAKDRARQ